MLSRIDSLHVGYRPAGPIVVWVDATATGGVYLSGAGPILAAFLPDSKTGPEIGDEALEILTRHGTPADAKVVRFQNEGLRVEHS